MATDTENLGESQLELSPEALTLPAVPDLTDPESKVQESTKVRLDSYIASCVESISRSEATKWVRAGQVLVNESVQSKPGYGLTSGDLVQCVLKKQVLAVESTVQRILPPREGFPVLNEIELLYEDEDLYVFLKPPGLTVHPGAGTDYSWTFMDEIKHRYPGLAGSFAGAASLQGSDVSPYEAVGGNTSSLESRPGLVHRLDKDTSGAIVVAKNKDSLRFLQSCFANRTIKRFYLCLLDGVLHEKSQTVDAWHVRSPTDRKKFIALEKDSESRLVRSAKHACSHFQQIKAFEGRLALCRVRLDTGRTHQIRVHAAHLHKWVLGDRSYGRPFEGGSKLGDVAIELASFKRQFLHAYRVVIPRSDQKPAIDVYCRPFRDMLPIISSLGYDEKTLEKTLRS